MAISSNGIVNMPEVEMQKMQKRMDMPAPVDTGADDTDRYDWSGRKKRSLYKQNDKGEMERDADGNLIRINPFTAGSKYTLRNEEGQVTGTYKGKNAEGNHVFGYGDGEEQQVSDYDLENVWDAYDYDKAWDDADDGWWDYEGNRYMGDVRSATMARKKKADEEYAKAHPEENVYTSTAYITDEDDAQSAKSVEPEQNEEVKHAPRPEPVEMRREAASAASTRGAESKYPRKPSAENNSTEDYNTFAPAAKAAVEPDSILKQSAASGKPARPEAPVIAKRSTEEDERPASDAGGKDGMKAGEEVGAKGPEQKENRPDKTDNEDSIMAKDNVTTGRDLPVDVAGNAEMERNVGKVIEQRRVDNEKRQAEQNALAGGMRSAEQMGTEYAAQTIMNADRNSGTGSAARNPDNEVNKQVQRMQQNGNAANKAQVKTQDNDGTGTTLQIGPAAAGKTVTYNDIFDAWKAEKDKVDAEYKRRKRKAAIIQGVLGAIEAVTRFAAKGAGQNVSAEYMQKTQKDIFDDWQQKRKDNDAMFQSRINDMYRQQQQTYQQQQNEEAKAKWEKEFALKQEDHNIKIQKGLADIQNAIKKGDYTEAQTQALMLKNTYAGTIYQNKVNEGLASIDLKKAQAEKARNGGSSTKKEKTEDEKRYDKSKADDMENKAQLSGSKVKAMGGTPAGSGGKSAGGSGKDGNSGGGKSSTKAERKKKAEKLGI